jgi:hypothetical protein
VPTTRTAARSAINLDQHPDGRRFAVRKAPSTEISAVNKVTFIFNFFGKPAAKSAVPRQELRSWPIRSSGPLNNSKQSQNELPSLPGILPPKKMYWYQDFFSLFRFWMFLK